MKHFYLICLFFFFSLCPLTAQISPDSLLTRIRQNDSAPREVVYLHLNKSLLLQGEELAFSAYVLNKNNLEASKATTNLYVQIKDDKGKLIQSKMLLVEDGITSNFFKISDKYISGDYTITAFTNWMRNSQEQNYFTGSFKVLESSLSLESNEPQEMQIDAQFLPESGHLLQGIVNNIGVTVKDNSGYGLDNAVVILKDSQNREFRKFKLNRFGIGKFSMIPEIGEEYSVVVEYGGREFPVDYSPSVEHEGIIFTANRRGSELNLVVRTNPESLSKLQEEPLVLVVRNRNQLEAYETSFRDRRSIPINLDLRALSSGINIITLFNKKGRPIAERIVFNYENLPLEEMPQAQISEVEDSLRLSFSFDDLKKKSLSVSILPQGTVVEKPTHNILSYNLLQPYVKGIIENGAWYFSDITEKKKYELDNLLITQGWSSYDWQFLFENNDVKEHSFEKHFSLKVEIGEDDRKKKNLQYLMHASEENELQIIDIPLETKDFYFDGYKPMEGEKLNISRIKRNGDLLPAEVSVQFFPNKIPNFETDIKPLNQKTYRKTILHANPNFSFLNSNLEVEELDEVVLTATRDKIEERERELNHHSFGDVSVISERDLLKYGTLAEYLRTKHFRVNEAGGTFSVTSSWSGPGVKITTGAPNDEVEASVSTAGPSGPIPADPLLGIAFFLDDNYVPDPSMFYNYSLSQIDRIEINKTGMGSGFIGENGSIKIYSKLGSGHFPVRDRERIEQIDVPLAYSRKKAFYIPKYENTSDEFFRRFGVIDWKPELVSENGEDIFFTINKPKVDFQMIIEGITENGKLIYDIKRISVEK